MFDRWGADCIVAEINYGGAMVNAMIQAARPGAPVKVVTASRGKVQRAEPVSALFELRRAFMVGHHPELEEQLCNFSSAGYQGSRSPDRADAMIWGLTELILADASGPWNNFEGLAS
jgi:phage terminase large subunit-like protein